VLNVRNGSLLVKSGSLQTTCACCGWSCYAPDAGACCDGAECRVVQQCDCDTENGEVFKGVGTVCSPNPCCLDLNGNPCGLLPNAGRPDNIYLTISGTGSVTLNRTFSLTWSQQDFAWVNYRNSQGFIESPIVRYGDSSCSRVSPFGGCLPQENSPSFRANIAVQITSLNTYRIVAQYDDYSYLPYGACNCTTWSVLGAFNNVPQCWGCDPSYGDSITGSIGSFQNSHGEVQQQNPIAVLSANPLP